MHVVPVAAGMEMAHTHDADQSHEDTEMFGKIIYLVNLGYPAAILNLNLHLLQHLYILN